ncbi:hypothetical protein [Legionella sp. W05-934-2]|jgi:hypothetical protein|uniref:hypothetical protein n=1 Tax=Legionella sp. W05-934-2 TaxID=1198649 RepID=UPI00346324C5
MEDLPLADLHTAITHLSLLTGCCLILTGFVALIEGYEKDINSLDEKYVWPLILFLIFPVSVIQLWYTLGFSDFLHIFVDMFYLTNIATRNLLVTFIFSFASMLVILKHEKIIKGRFVGLAFGLILITCGYYVFTHHVPGILGQYVIEYNIHINFLLGLTLGISGLSYILDDFFGNKFIFRIIWAAALMINGILKLTYTPELISPFAFTTSETQYVYKLYILFILVSATIFILITLIHLFYKHVKK